MKASRRHRLPLLVHYHIYKNAGSSFEWALGNALRDGFRSFDSSAPGTFISARDLADFSARHPEVRAISSHQAVLPAPMIRGRDVYTSILIRDPIARIRSMYAFERRQQEVTSGSIKAKKLDLKEYVEWRLEVWPSTVCNYQVRFCSRAPAIRPRAPGRPQLREAIVNLDTVAIVGTVTRYEEWLALAEKILSEPFPNITLPFVRRNATAGNDLSKRAILEELFTELGNTTARYLLENNQLDMDLHRMAEARLTRDLAEQSLGMALL